MHGSADTVRRHGGAVLQTPPRLVRRGLGRAVAHTTQLAERTRDWHGPCEERRLLRA